MESLQSQSQTSTLTEEEGKRFLDVLSESYDLYITHGTRSNKSVNHFHNYIKEELEKLFNDEKYTVKLEYNIKSLNSSGNKRCDLVILRNNEPYIIFPVKMIKSTFQKNKNNTWENLTGELSHIVWANPDIKIIPINIFMDKIPLLNEKKLIIRFEKLSFDDISNYNRLKEHHLAYDLINYIIDVEHNVNIDEAFTAKPTLVGFNEATPFRSMYEIVKDLV